MFQKQLQKRKYLRIKIVDRPGHVNNYYMTES